MKLYSLRTRRAKFHGNIRRYLQIFSDNSTDIPVIIGDNKLPNFFKKDDLERLGRCFCGSNSFGFICFEFGLGIEQCQQCGLIRTNPRLKQTAIRRCYEESSKKGGGIFFKATGSKERISEKYKWRHVSLRYRTLAQRLRALCMKNNISKPSLLEVGFAGGRFIKELSKAGFSAYGFDITETGVRRLYSEGYSARYAPSLQEAHYPDNFFDMVVTWEVFEHVPDPDRFSEEVLRIVKPGGYWFIQVPNWRWINLKMRLIDKLPEGHKMKCLTIYGVANPIFHLFNYTHESLKNMLESSGFEHKKSLRIRLFNESNWKALVAHELLYIFDSVPAILSNNKCHWNVVLTEIYQRPGSK